ncbi:MAG: ATP-binding cassette domain-containing protein [Cetobacterium sp.]|uniref:sugar ABC transporter ATP-binding protein n=1 Tax=unclassified Cetobacterium TaxID=2630983 RepID=UPI000646B78A|nr:MULTISPECIES: sugar ABC transporter ATP-binding protein [unclassified Cetobacterium]
MKSNFILEMKNITKKFNNIKALDNVNIKVKKGEIHSICGENGAGKSTLMKVLSGVYPSGTFTGEIYFNEKLCKFNNIKESEKEGIVIIHQELALMPNMTIAENIFLGNEKKNKLGIDWNTTMNEAISLLKKVGLKEDPGKLIQEIGVGKQQLVEIAKALAKDVKILILDEPTAALNENDSENLLKLLKHLQKEEGVTSIMISHKLNEIAEVADSVTIIRDGKTIETIVVENQNLSQDRIIRGMVGRDITDRYPSRESNPSEVFFELKEWQVNSRSDKNKEILTNINFHVKKGEVIGIAGLMGSGRTELALSIFGESFGNKVRGIALKDGEKIDISTIGKAIDNKIAYITEDRKGDGLILDESIKFNTTLSNWRGISKKGILNNEEEIVVAEEFRKKLRIKSNDIEQNVTNLSGGNQQKVLLAKWLYTDPDVFILDEPTRGIDVGAKYEIYSIINELVENKKSVIIISSEMPELIGMSDRIYVMSEGRINGEIHKSEFSQEKIMELAI